jgi:hypothetical protein
MRYIVGLVIEVERPRIYVPNRPCNGSEFGSITNTPIAKIAAKTT